MVSSAGGAPRQTPPLQGHVNHSCQHSPHCLPGDFHQPGWARIKFTTGVSLTPGHPPHQLASLPETPPHKDGPDGAFVTLLSPPTAPNPASNGGFHYSLQELPGAIYATGGWGLLRSKIIESSSVSTSIFLIMSLPYSKAVMDLLVDLCCRYHLNPAHHTLELQSWGSQQPLSYKPNTLMGALDTQMVFLKEKVPEGKTKRPPPPPKIPEKTVRLVVNYLKTQKALVRVSPEVPLRSIIPAICEKCEVSQEHIVLLRDGVTGEELELAKSLNELGIKELYAWDKKRETRHSSISSDTTEREKRSFLGFFRVNKRSHKECATAPNSPSVNSRSVTLGPSLSLGNISGMTATSDLKKRRAPPPPTVTPSSQSMEASAQEKSPAQLSGRDHVCLIPCKAPGTSLALYKCL
uniref:Cordon-bleu ubiquitin-like domain-containing protein n=1 Tax=Sphenodon punctatus TaxID=8508 RepID=A0A8D0HKG7_SPHPU